MAINEQFTEELRALLNRHSVDNEANIPDFILAEALTEQIQSMADMNNKRERWFGRGSKETLQLDPPNRADVSEGEAKSNQAMVDELFAKTPYRYENGNLYLNDRPNTWTKCTEDLKGIHEAWQKRTGK